MTWQPSPGHYSVLFRALNAAPEDEWKKAKEHVDFPSALRIGDALAIKYGNVARIGIGDEETNTIVHEPDRDAHGWICTGCLTKSEPTDDATFPHMHHCNKGGTVEALLGTMATWGRALGAF